MSRSQAVLEQFVGAYRPFVSSRVAELGASITGELDAAIAEGEEWLRSELSALVGRPFEEQTRGPLEVFQMAIRFPTEVLAAQSVPPVRRDEVERAALPFDDYRLAPASSRDLGESAWRAHLQWGMAKAAAMKGTT